MIRVDPRTPTSANSWAARRLVDELRLEIGSKAAIHPTMVYTQRADQKFSFDEHDDVRKINVLSLTWTLGPRLCPPTVTMSAPTSVAIPTTVAAPVTETAAASATATTTSANPLAAFTW